MWYVYILKSINHPDQEYTGASEDLNQRVDVREENHRAMKLYKKFGFKIEGMKQNATRMDGVYSNDYLMALIDL